MNILNPKKEGKKKKLKQDPEANKLYFFDMYIVHEHQVEENVLAKTYLLANKIYCMYIPCSFSPWDMGRSLSQSLRGVLYDFEYS